MPQFLKYLSSPLSYFKQIKSNFHSDRSTIFIYLHSGSHFFLFSSFHHPPPITKIHTNIRTYQMWSMRVLARSCRSSLSCLCRNRGNTSASRRCTSITRRTLRNRSLPNHLGRTYQSSFFFC